MDYNNQRAREKEVLRDIEVTFPTFLDGMNLLSATKDPPDFLGECNGGQKIGLELTAWLNSAQTKDAKGRQHMREDLLRIIDWQKHPRPKNVSSAVIIPRWGNRIRVAHYKSFCKEFHAAAQHIDSAWKTLRAKHWAPLRPEDRFSYEAHQSELFRSFPTLCRYISSIFFFERTDSASNEQSWVSIELDGGLYDPTWSIQALAKAIESKIGHYSSGHIKAHLNSQHLQKLYLLVYAHPELFGSNTPFQTSSQMMISPVEGLPDTARAATENLSILPKVFDRIYLFYSLWNSRWLAQIWPTFDVMPALCESDSARKNLGGMGEVEVGGEG